jgi:hypothetical protein
MPTDQVIAIITADAPLKLDPGAVTAMKVFLESYVDSPAEHRSPSGRAVALAA